MSRRGARVSPTTLSNASCRSSSCTSKLRSMLLRISHRTRFVYDQPARDSHNELRVRPLDDPEQRCIAFQLSVDQPAAVLSYRDFFGNHAHSVSVGTPHRELTIVAQSLVERFDAPRRVFPPMAFRDFL